ncbi:MAG: hypothetical protein OEU92_00470 [Alphaproteobacteria bacterium]|nr:hypothetical protein [Alphaproteobacteria bacterium]
MADAMRYVGQAAIFLLFAVVIGTFADSPSYRHFPEDQAQIKLSFSHGAAPKVPCKTLTREEMNALPPNMRRATSCERERLPVEVEIDLDGELLYRASVPPSGLAKDGPSRVYQRFTVSAGRHELATRLRDTDRTDGFDYERKIDIELIPGQSLAIDFRSETGGFLVR